ncbi:TetR/AcrR family transcriptional regulator C-terminal ligand-binding domain-containing protein (plasmid) [Klebsiella sp. B345]|uniref:TetR-like C-terminal domain-containing protein n=1 Tax=Klebsiella sp. B345 TaxID=2755398 RepID=UPI003DA84B67
MKSNNEMIKPLDAVRIRTGGRNHRVRKAVLEAAKEILVYEGIFGLTHRNIAQRAGVNASTVYRRWPDRHRLIADVLSSTAEDLIQIPNTGNLREDLMQFLLAIVSMLSSPIGLKLSQGCVTALASADDVVRDTITNLWKDRFQQTEIIFKRAERRGEKYPTLIEPQVLMEMLIAPLWFRTLITSMPVDEAFLAKNINALFSFDSN